MGKCPTPIEDESQTVIELPINLPGNPDLASCPLETVCITLSHTWVGDISISLQSPNGEHYLIMSDAGNNRGECGTASDNAEICIERGTNHPLMNNVDYACNPAPCSLGTCCLNGNWTVPCGGVTSPLTDAVQAPNCNLNDFNLPGAPANGVWKLTLLDVCITDIGILHNVSLNFGCGGNAGNLSCEANGGTLNTEDVVLCSNYEVDATPNFCGNEPPFANYLYKYAVAKNDTILAFLPTPNLTGFPDGQYEIYGFSYADLADALLANHVGASLQSTISLFDSNSKPFCGDFSADGFLATVYSQYSAHIGPDLVLDCWETAHQLSAVYHPTSGGFTYSWLLPTGQTTIGQTSIQATVSGQYVFTASSSTVGCSISDTMQLTIPPPLIADIATQTASCNQADGTASVVLQPGITNAAFAWSNGAADQANSGLAQGWYSVTVNDQYCSYHQNAYVDEDRSCKVTIRGRIINDGSDGDCIADPMPLGVECIMLHLLPADIYTYSLADGSYEFVVDAGDYTIEYVDEDRYELLCATSNAIPVSLPNDGSVADGNNFFVKKTLRENLSISLIKGPARPGFEQFYQFEYCNFGTRPTDVTITMTHDPLLVQGPTGNVPPNSYDPATHTAIWTIGGVPVGVCRKINFYLQVPTSVQLGTSLSGHIHIGPTDEDPVPENNSISWTQTVVGAYDPNEKSTQTGENQWGGRITESDSILRYQVLFQNTGTDTAFTVVVRDTLDADLDVETIRPGLASHPYRLEFEGNNVLVFNFRDIMLPDSNRNEPASHGALTFSIKRKPGLAIGTKIHNRAAIYFDYNAPIITNTVTHSLGRLQVNTQQQAIICEGDAYNGIVYESDTTLVAMYSFTNYDSVVTTEIDILPAIEHAYSTIICEGSSYLFNGQYLNLSGQYETVLTAANGCDSTVTLNLTVVPTITTYSTATICAGETYSFAGQNLSATGNYQSSFTAVGGCDSTAVLALNVLENTSSQLSAWVCPGESYVFNGQTLTSPGVYQANLTAANGCDSMVTLALNYYVPITSYIFATICPGETYQFNGQTLNMEGIYQADLTATNNGCDSTVTLYLNLYEPIASSVSATICSNESYPFNGQILTASGLYVFTLTAANGCDSTVTLALTVLPTVANNMQATICEGDSIEFGGQIITQAGTYQAVFQAANGCDSTLTLLLNVEANPVQHLSAEICQGEVYVHNGQVFAQSGDYTLNSTTSSGCTSTTLLHLLVMPNSVNFQQIQLVAGSHWNGVPIYEDSTIEEHYTAANGCDSTVFVQITVLSGTDNVAASDYDLLVFPNPFDASTTIELKGFGGNQPLTFQLLDVTGRVLRRQPFRSPSLTLQREGMAPGLYFIKITSEDGRPVAVGRMVAK